MSYNTRHRKAMKAADVADISAADMSAVHLNSSRNNSSYITVVRDESDSEDSSMCETTKIVTMLRDRLARADATIDGLRVDIDRLERKILGLKSQLDARDETVSHMRSLVADLARVRTVTDAAVQCDVGECMSLRPDGAGVDRALRENCDAELGPRVLVLADSQGRNVAASLRRHLSEGCRVEVTFKPNALLMDVIADCVGLARDFGVNDNVVFLASMNDVLRGLNLAEDRLLGKMKHLSNTNLLIISVPYLNNNFYIKDEVSRFNMALYRCCEMCRPTQSVAYADVNCVLESRDMQKFGPHLTRSGRVKLSKYICQLLSYVGVQLALQLCEESGTLRPNLIYVKISDGLNACEERVRNKNLIEDSRQTEKVFWEAPMMVMRR